MASVARRSPSGQERGGSTHGAPSPTCSSTLWRVSVWCVSLSSFSPQITLSYANVRRLQELKASYEDDYLRMTGELRDDWIKQHSVSLWTSPQTEYRQDLLDPGYVLHTLQLALRPHRLFLHGLGNA